MSRLTPKGFATIREAANKVAVALYSGKPDRKIVRDIREAGFDVADGAAIDDAISEIWIAVDKGSLEAFAVGPRRESPLRLSAEDSKQIPTLRNPRGGDFGFLRPSMPIHRQFVEWLGLDLSMVAVVFEDKGIAKLERALLAARRRREKSTGNKVGRPSRQIQVEPIIRRAVDQGRWSATQSVKALTQVVNRLGEWACPVSDDTVRVVLNKVHEKTGDRRFERRQRATRS